MDAGVPCGYRGFQQLTWVIEKKEPKPSAKGRGWRLGSQGRDERADKADPFSGSDEINAYVTRSGAVYLPAGFNEWDRVRKPNVAVESMTAIEVVGGRGRSVRRW